MKGDKKPAEWWTPTLLQTKGTFETGATDTFMLSREEDLGTITGIKLSHKSGGMFGDKWFCDKVRVFPIATGRQWVFEVNDWVNDDGIELGAPTLATAGYEKKAERAAKARRVLKGW